MVYPGTRLHGWTRRDTDCRVLAAHRRDGVVQYVLPIHEVDIRRPEGAVAREVDDGAVGEYRANLSPWTDREGEVKILILLAVEKTKYFLLSGLYQIAGSRTTTVGPHHLCRNDVN